jgi:hypothetical protein
MPFMLKQEKNGEIGLPKIMKKKNLFGSSFIKKKVTLRVFTILKP